MSESSKLSIGPFELAGVPRSLWFGDSPVELDARPLELLVAIARHPDGIAAAQLWPLVTSGSPFDEDVLCELVGHINQALGRWSPACYVAWYPDAAVPRFALVDATRRASLAGTLPAPRSDVFGRDEAIARIVGQLRARRFLTVLAAGGMGKTTVALAAAHAASADFPDGVHFVDLAPFVDARLVAQGVATAVGCVAAGVDPLEALRRWAGERRALVVLDSCEHVIDAASLVAETLVGGAPHIAVLATSREPLRAAGEWLHRLAPMRLPQAGEAVSAANALEFPALRLFIERAVAADPGFTLRDEDVPLLVSLCGRLDGIALAIEIVAARVDTLGLAMLASQLEERLLGLPTRRRTAPVRHATLNALLDWSFQLLSAAEQQVLRRLSVFRNGFTMDAAVAVVADAALDAAAVQEAILDLMAKSLVTPSRSGDVERLRLLDTTRAYAGARLEDAGERDPVRRCHAAWIAATLADSEGSWIHLGRQAWVDRHAPLIDDVRAALDWAFEPGGDVMQGARMTLSGFALGRQMLLIDEFTRRADHAVERLGATGSEPSSPARAGDAGALQMRLNFVVGCVGTAYDARVSDLAGRLESLVTAMPEAAGALDRFAAFNSMWALCVRRGDFREGGDWATRLDQLADAADDPVARMVADRIQAQTLHFLGRHADAAGRAQRVIGEAWRPIPLAYNPSPVELRVSMRVVLARALWMQGHPDRAAAMAAEAMEQARTDSPLAQCQAIVMGSIVVALWSGLDESAGALSAQLRGIENLQGFDYWLHWGTRFREVLALRTGPHAPGAPEAGFSEEDDLVLADHLATMDERWLSPTCIHRVEAGRVGWCAPEALRLQGERALRRPAADGVARGEALLCRSLALAREQGALSWELRTATSLARHWRSVDRAAEARALLEPVHGRFAEGFQTADWRAASALLGTL